MDYELSLNTSTADSLKLNSDPFISYTWNEIGIVSFSGSILVVATIANALVLFLTARERKLHNGYMYIRSLYALMDILVVWGIIPVFIANIIFPNVPQRLTCYISDIGFGMFLCTLHMNGIIALERYCFFCHPMKYDQLFNMKIIVTTCVVIVLVTQCYIIVSDVINLREFQFVTLMCLDKNGIHPMIKVVLKFSFSKILLSISTSSLVEIFLWTIF